MQRFNCKVSYRKSALDLAAINFLDTCTSHFFNHGIQLRMSNCLLQHTTASWICLPFYMYGNEDEYAATLRLYETGTCMVLAAEVFLSITRSKLWDKYKKNITIWTKILALWCPVSSTRLNSVTLNLRILDWQLKNMAGVTVADWD